jgi:hypothetical protein
MEFPSSPTSETHQNGPVSQQQVPSEVREARYSTIPPPPPLNISQAPASQPTTSSPPPTFVPPPVIHRHSDVPSSTANTHNVTLPARPRLSDIPNVSSRSSGGLNVLESARTPPPNFPGPRHSAFPGFVLPYDKKPAFAPKPSEATSRSQALYASANVRMNAPSVRIDLNKLAYSEHAQNQPTHGVKDGNHAPGSFYSYVSSLVS